MVYTGTPYQPHPCQHCGESTLIYNTAIGDSSCESCGLWESDRAPIDRASDIAKAFRAARRYYGESAGRGAYRPAHVALDIARRARRHG